MLDLRTGRRSSACRTGRSLGALLALAVTVAGSGPAPGQELPFEAKELIRGGLVDGPNNFGLALDADGNLFVGSQNSKNVVRVAPPGALASGCLSAVVSEATARDQGVDFAGPKGIAVGANGSLYVATTGGSTNLDDTLTRVDLDGTIVRLVNRAQLGPTDWNPAGLALDERPEGPYVYATGPAGGGVARVAPDLTVTRVFNKGGQGLVVDRPSRDVFFAQTGDGIYRIPEADQGSCDVGGKECRVFMSAVSPSDPPNLTGCDGAPIRLSGAYGLALVDDVLYVTGQNSNNVLRRPLRDGNSLGLPVCIQEIFKDGDAGLVLRQPRAVAADGAGNVYVAGNTSNNLIWLRPDPTDPARAIPQELVNENNGLRSPLAVAVDAAGNAYVSGSVSSTVFRIRTVAAGQACGDGVKSGAEACDFAAHCCCSVLCEVQQPRGLCRDPAGPCDLNDTCNGASPDCLDARRDASHVCRPVGGLCDLEERCAGDVACPPDLFETEGTACRAGAGPCDLAEFCTGTGPDCPRDAVLPAATTCRAAAGGCDLAEECSGSSPGCPEDVARGPGLECVLTPSDLRGAEPQCVLENGVCTDTRECKPVVERRPCVPATPGLDPRCLVDPHCEEPGTCVFAPVPDGEPCGNPCDDSVCQGGACVARTSPHPCGGGELERCDPLAPPGQECRLCGDGVVQPWEDCDDGNRNENDGCSARCRIACSPATPCVQPTLDGNVADPCRRRDCLPVDFDPMLGQEGAACVPVLSEPGCVGCISDRECGTSDPCAVARCEDNRCRDVPKTGLERATCSFTDGFPGPDPDGACAPAGGNKPGALRTLARREAKVLAMLENALCASGAAEPSPRVVKQVRQALRRAVLLANTLRTPFRGQITNACERLLVARFDTMLQRLEEAKASGWTCPARATAPRARRG